MRLLHTSDWHLGHRLHGASREREHGRFLRWLVETCEAEAVDALIVAGDVFDTANPPAEAQRLYYGFLASCLRLRPSMQIVIIGGNHDSPARLDAAADVLRPLRVHVFGGLGGLPRAPAGLVELEQAVVPLYDGGGGLAAWLVAIPYLRPVDWPAQQLPAAAAEAEPTPDEARLTASRLLTALRGVYDRLFAAARRKQRPGQALLAVGHCLLAGGAVSLDSERRIQLGNSLPLPADVFPPDVAYVALGHLHRAQRIGEVGHVRYSGSPLPLSFSEVDYPHQVVLVDLEDGKLAAVRPLPVPRTREVLSVPPEPHPLAEVLPILRQLPRADACEDEDDDDEHDRPLLEVRVRIAPGELLPNLRPPIEEALLGARARLLRIVCQRPGDAAGPDALHSEAPLQELDPEEVFLRLYRQAVADPDAAVPPLQLELFRRLLEDVESGQPTGAAP